MTNVNKGVKITVKNKLYGRHVMQQTKIILRDIQSVRNFVQQVILLDYDVDLIQGRYTVDAKSIMGIFALDILSPITVIAHTENAGDFFAKIGDFIAE